MTANQINYWRFNEDRRHNEVTEVETARHNRATESIGYGQISLGYAQLAETTRTNKARELLNSRSLGETVRHNMYAESLQSRQISLNYQMEKDKLAETSRHNTVVELETQRHNMTTEDIQKRTLDWNIASGTHQIVTGYINSAANLIRAGSDMVDSSVGVAKVVLPLLGVG